jgi:hypothetical protein
MLKSKLVLSKKKITILTATALCVVLIASSALYLFPGQVAQAAIINPHPGLVGWWSFNEGSGTVVGDGSGDGNTGTINGATWIGGKYGNALSFDGTSSYVNIANSASLGLTTDFTISAWIKVTHDSINDRPILSKRASVGVNVPFSFYIRNNQVRFTFNDGSWHDKGSTLTFPQNVWVNLAVTLKDSKLHFFINGIDDGEQSYVVTLPVSNTVLDIGQELALSQFFNGAIDEVRIYNRSLTQTEIQAEFNGGPDSSANILAKVPQGTTQIITTLSWQGTGNIDLTLASPSQSYTENMLSEYEKSTYSTLNGITSLLNIKRLSVSVTALPSDENWYIALTLDKVDNYQISVEVQK